MVRKERKKMRPSIEELPEELLIKIVSSLSLKDAVRTSVLSSRWRHLWKYISSLVLDAKNVLPRETNKILSVSLKRRPISYEPRARSMPREITQKFISHADFILGSHHGLGSIESLVLKFSLSQEHAAHLDSWCSFAAASRTKKFVLNLGWRCKESLYDFPCEFFTSEGNRGVCFLEILKLKFCSLKLPSSYYGFKNLRMLSLRSVVNATDEVIQDLLPVCVALKCLTFNSCNRLFHLKIMTSLCKLEVLKVKRCKRLRVIECHASSLSKFKYFGDEVLFNFSSALTLEKASISLEKPFSSLDSGSSIFAIAQISRVMPSLKALQLLIDKEFKLSCSQAMFIHLKCLELIIEFTEDIAYVTSLIDAAPFLENFSFRVLNTCPAARACCIKQEEEVRTLPGYPHYYLRNVKMSGYGGSKGQLELLRFIFRNATRLEDVKIRCCPFLSGRQVKGVLKVFEERLYHEVPRHIRLVIH